MDIKETVVQGLIKDAGSTIVTENFREDPTPLNDYMISLGEELLKVYGKATNNYGAFDADHNTHRFPANLEQYVSGAVDVVGFSKSTCRLIAAKLNSTPPATGGYVCFLRYENQGRDWLIIAMVKVRIMIGIDEAEVELNQRKAFDTSHLHEAARIDIEKWRNQEEPYLSFIKRSGRQDDVTQYFRLALGCTEYTDAAHNTRQAMNAVDAYSKANNWTPERHRETRKKVFDFFEEKKKSGEPVNLTALSGMVDDQEPEAFAEFVRGDDDIQVNETFSPHPKTYRELKRITEKFGNISVAFDVQDVVNGDVDYDEDSGKLLISHPSDKLIEKINKAKGNDLTD